MPRLHFSGAACRQLKILESSGSYKTRLKAVRAALAKLELNPDHPGLNSHSFKGKKCPHGKTLFESYAQNRTPGAYRLFWCHDPDDSDTLLIVAITPHP